MAAITSLGIGSGLDLNTMVTQLVAVESQPLQALQTRASTLQTSVSLYGQISSLFSTLQTASQKLSDASLWSSSTASSADASVVQVVSDSGAAAGNYSVSVQKMAASQTLVSGASYTSVDEPVGSGTLNLDVGTWQQQPMNFVPQVGRAPIAITVTSSDTLQTLAEKINSTGAGVTASIVTDSSGSRLALKSSSTGASNGFRLTASDSDGNNTDAAGLSRFAYDPATSAGQMTQAVAAQDAQATVNGISVTSASNDLSTVVSGLTLRLRKLSSDSVDVAVSSDTTSIQSAVQGFVDAYNGLASNIQAQTKYDATAKKGGPLQGDSTVLGLQNQMRSLVAAGSSASSTFGRLSDIGISMTRDGTLSVNSTKLTAALGNLSELKKAFANNGNGDSTQDGFARRYANLATNVLGTDGSLTLATAGLQARLTQNSKDQDNTQSRIDAYKARLVAQYTAMDANQSKLTALSNYVTQQMNALTAMANKTN